MLLCLIIEKWLMLCLIWWWLCCISVLFDLSGLISDRMLLMLFGVVLCRFLRFLYEIIVLMLLCRNSLSSMLLLSDCGIRCVWVMLLWYVWIECFRKNVLLFWMLLELSSLVVVLSDILWISLFLLLMMLGLLVRKMILLVCSVIVVVDVMFFIDRLNVLLVGEKLSGDSSMSLWFVSE